MRLGSSVVVETERNQRLDLPKGCKIASQKISLAADDIREDDVKTARVMAMAAYITTWGVIPDGEVYVETIIHDLVSVTCEVKTYPY